MTLLTFILNVINLISESVVVSLSNLAYFNGASRIIFWRYTNFDFQRSITLKFRFKSQSQSRNAPHPMLSLATVRD
jgi:hypothetical protein